MNKRCVVTFAKGHNFLRGLERLEDQCKKLDIDFFGFKEYPEGCPTHESSPFAFKFFCIKEAVKLGYSQILWLDTSVIIKGSLNEVFNYIESRGYFFIYNHDVGSFCHDKALKTLNITREESFSIPCMQGTNFGLNFNDAKICSFFNKILDLSLDGITFPGPHNNNNFEASRDMRVKGHRHDQIAMSVIAIKSGLSNWHVNGGETPWFIHDRNYVKDVESTVINIDMSEP